MYALASMPDVHFMARTTDAPRHHQETEMERPEFITEDMMLFVNVMDHASKTNLFVAVPKVMEMFPWLSSFQAQQVLLYSPEDASVSAVLAEL